jgi:hypothetical protein
MTAVTVPPSAGSSARGAAPAGARPTAPHGPAASSLHAAPTPAGPAPDEAAEEQRRRLRLGLLTAGAATAVLLLGGPGETLRTIAATIASQVMVDAASGALMSAIGAGS